MIVEESVQHSQNAHGVNIGHAESCVVSTSHFLSEELHIQSNGK